MMHKNKILFISLLSSMILAFVACGSDDQLKDTSTTQSGESIYKKSCASCHGEDLSGGAGPTLQNITDKYSKDDIKDIINHGIGTMFPVNIPDEEQDVLIDWLSEQ